MIDRSQVYRPNHPNAYKHGQIIKYQLVAAEALGKPLPPFAVVHHHGDNQLVICEDEKYHRLLEVREAAFKATGDVHKRTCSFCKQWDELINLRWSNGYYHKFCKVQYTRDWRVKQRLEGE